MKYVLLAAVILCIASASAQSVSALFGYTDMNLSQQKNYIRSLEKFSGFIKMPDQKNFPANVYFAGAFEFVTSEKYSLGIEVLHLRTNAYSLYGDVLGTIDLRSSFRTTLAGFRAERRYTILPDLKLSVGATAGGGVYNWNIEEKVCVASSYVSKSSSTDDGTVVFIDLHARIEQLVYRQLWAAFETGYRFGAKLPNDFLKDSNKEYSDFDYNLNGARAAIALKYYFSFFGD